MGLIPNTKESKQKFNLRSFFSKLLSKDTDQNFLISKKNNLTNYGKVVNDENVKRKEGNTNTPQLSAKIETKAVNKWKAPQILKTNLMQVETEIHINWKEKINLLILSCCFVILLVAFLYAGLLFWEEQKYMAQNQIKEEISTLVSKIDDLTKEINNADIFRRKVKLANQLLNTHVHWTNFFDFMEKNTLPNVHYLNGFSGSIDGVYSLAAVADTYNDAYQQVKIFSENKMVKSVTVTSVTQTLDDNKSAVQFTINLEINPEIFTNYE